VPGLSKLPVVGNLFKYRTRSRAKTNLMVFLRPTVIRTNEQSVDISGDRYNYMRDEQTGHQPQAATILPDLGAPQLPPLENGRLQNGTQLNPTPTRNSEIKPES
jgi:general secretion pathway protein D